MKEENNIYEVKKKRKKILILIGVIIIFLGIGYAYLQTLLTISGTTKVEKNTWNVYWDNLLISPDSVMIGTGDSEATINPNTKTSITYTISLKKPGDYYEFIVDAKNDGTIDAMISTITKTVNDSEDIPGYLDYTVTYDDNEPVLQKQRLRAGTMETYKVKVAYRQDINANQLPGDDATLSLTFGVTYKQEDSTAIDVRNAIFHVNDYTAGFVVGQQVPTGHQTFDNYLNAIDEIGYPMFIRLILGSNNVIEKNDVGFILNDRVYYLRMEPNSYENNKTTLNRAFGLEYCQNTLDDDDPLNPIVGYQCMDENQEYVSQVLENGSVLFGVMTGVEEMFICAGDMESGLSSCMEMET